jgi:hypothetical protein
MTQLSFNCRFECLHQQTLVPENEGPESYSCNKDSGCTGDNVMYVQPFNQSLHATFAALASDNTLTTPAESDACNSVSCTDGDDNAFCTDKQPTSWPSARLLPQDAWLCVQECHLWLQGCKMRRSCYTSLMLHCLPLLFPSRYIVPFDNMNVPPPPPPPNVAPSVAAGRNVPTLELYIPVLRSIANAGLGH